jgi:hypothetical protein
MGKKLRHINMDDSVLACIKCNCHIFPHEESDSRILWEEYVDDKLTGYHRCRLFSCVEKEIWEALIKTGLVHVMSS